MKQTRKLRPRGMTVAQLRAKLADLPDDAFVLTGAPDHRYRDVVAFAQWARWDGESATWTQDHGEMSTPTAEFGEPRRVLVVE